MEKVILPRNCEQTSLEERFVKVAGYNTRYLEDGDSDETLVLIHGLGASAERWLGVIPHLKSKYRLIIPDLIGFGYSDKPSVDYTIEFLSNFVFKLLGTLGIEKASMIGASLGGQVVAECASTQTGIIEKIVLVSPSGIMKRSTPALDAYMLAALYPTVDNAHTALRMMTEKGEVVPALVNDFVTRMTLPNAKFAFLSTVLGIRNSLDFEEKLRKIRSPTLIVWGKQDKMIPVEYASPFISAIRESKFIEIQGCGHVPHVEQPKKFSELVVSFLGHELVMNSSHYQ
jgi:2-hydroxy-6-oxonona-2,4-dienedioate hydrolase